MSDRICRSHSPSSPRPPEGLAPSAPCQHSWRQICLGRYAGDNLQPFGFVLSFRCREKELSVSFPSPDLFKGLREPERMHPSILLCLYANMSLRYNVDMDGMRDIEQLFKGLADVTRLRILNLLLHGELCVCDIQYVLDSAQPNISRHLMYMKNSGLVLDRREGQRIYY